MYTFVLGYYCDFADRPLVDYTPYPCPIGYFCPNGTEYSTQFGCPAGTYNPYTMLEKEEDCTQCDAGKYCSGTGKSTVTGKLITTNSLLHWCSGTKSLCV